MIVSLFVMSLFHSIINKNNNYFNVNDLMYKHTKFV